MFKKYDIKLKSTFKKVLQSTNDFYLSPIGPEEESGIAFMWSNVMKDNGNVMVARFRKNNFRLGIRVNTIEQLHKVGNVSFHHRVVEIVPNSLVSQTRLRVDDILLEVNGVNLRQLSYRQMSLVLMELPDCVQLVIWRTELYDHIDQHSAGASSDRTDTTSTQHEAPYTFTLKILVHARKKMQPGVRFIENTESKLPGWSRQHCQCRCIVEKMDTDMDIASNYRTNRNGSSPDVSSNSYCKLDSRIGPGDAILRVNHVDMCSLSRRNCQRVMSGLATNRVVVLWLCKFTGPRYGLRTSTLLQSAVSDSAAGSWQRGKLPPPPESNFGSNMYSSKHSPLTKSTPNIHTRISPKSLKNNFNRENWQSINSSFRNTDPVRLTVVLNHTDDIKVFLTDVYSEYVPKKSLICEINSKSSLQAKLHNFDQIVKVNETDVIGWSSKDIGALLKKVHSQMVPPTGDHSEESISRQPSEMTITVVRGPRSSHDINYGIISASSASLDSEAVLSFKSSNDNSVDNEIPVVDNEDTASSGNNENPDPVVKGDGSKTPVTASGDDLDGEVVQQTTIKDDNKPPNEFSDKIQKIKLTIHRVKNAFGLRIQNMEGPTILDVLNSSPNLNVRPGDKIERINDVYVLDKPREFVLTLIHSCGKSMSLDLVRPPSTRPSLPAPSTPTTPAATTVAVAHNNVYIL